MNQLQRRGFHLGQASNDIATKMPKESEIQQHWADDQAIVLPSLLTAELDKYRSHIQQAHRLMEGVVQSAEVSPYFDSSPYNSALKQNFAIAATSMEEHDEQGIEKIYIDAVQQGEEDVIAEGLWCKASWLSFAEQDVSLRFRFSWGMEGYEDVASDPLKQDWAGQLCDVIFPESALITQNNAILSHLQAILGRKPAFVERIVYFNAPHGGAQFHHDVERGHAGVVFAQLSGTTFWLTLAKPKLIDEIIHFVQQQKNNDAITTVLSSAQDRQALIKLCEHREQLSDYMEEADHELIEAIIDRCSAFIQQLIQHGYSHQLQAGDVLLLPQRDINHCVWHSVFTLGEEAGEALSFAVR